MVGDLTLRDVTIQQYFGTEPRPNSASRNRRAMLEKVGAIWIAGVLEPSLPHDILLDLGLTERPAMVARTLDLYVQRPDLANQVQAPSTRLIDIFDHLDRALLILGAPGAGKTTLLLTLARDLLVQAAKDPEQPIPVVFPLSSWAERRRPLATWLIDALNEQYDVPRKTGQAWVEADQILPLLDGLDEVAAEHRAACVETINTFRQNRGLLPLVVCCRVADYEALETRLRLQGALVVQPLTQAQVDSYLAQVGQRLGAVRQALQDDPTLWELLDTPLMLTIVTLAYAGESVEAFRMQGTLDERGQHLFATYVDRMFRRRGANPPYPPQQTVCWLAWLAWQLAQHSQTVFYIERLQPDWLPQRQRWVPTQGARLVASLGSGLAAGLAGGLGFGLVGGLAAGLSGVLLCGMVGAIIGALTGYSVEITSIDTVRWSGSRFLSELLLPSYPRIGEPGLMLATGLVAGLVAGGAEGGGLAGGLVAGLVAGLSFGAVGWLGFGLGLLLIGLTAVSGVALEAGLSGWLGFGQFAGLAAGLVYKLYTALVAGVSSGEIATKTMPNEGIHRSARIALVGGLAAGLVAGLTVGLAEGFSPRLTILYTGAH